MSRTFRNPNPRYGIFVREERVCVREDERYTYTFTDLIHKRVAKHGWREAKETVSAKEYARARKDRGDCSGKFYLNGSLPHYWRNTSSRKVRQQWQRESHHFLLNAAHEIDVFDSRKVKTFYW